LTTAELDSALNPSEEYEFPAYFEPRDERVSGQGIPTWSVTDVFPENSHMN